MKRLLIFSIAMLWASISHATQFSDLKFGPAQLSDTQWNVSACLYTTTCQIYSLSGIGISWNTGSPISVGSSQYIAFTQSGNGSWPWHMYIYNSNGSVARDLGIGKLAVQGQDTAGNYYFFFTNSGYNGTVFSTTKGFSSSAGFSFTGTSNPTVPQTNSFASTGSTSPLSSGQSYTPVPTYTSSITSAEQARYNSAQSRRLSISSNGIYINNSGSSNQISIDQVGRNEQVAGIGQQSMPVNGSGNHITIAQGDTISYQGQILLEANIYGSYNVVSVNQGRSLTGVSSGADMGGHYASVSISGDSNAISISQVGSLHYAETTITGSNNTHTLSQTGSSQQYFGVVNGNSNSVNATQSGTSNFLDVSLSGPGNSVVVNQSGNSQNRATISLINSGGPAGVNLTQTGGQVYSIQQTCVTPTGCGTITVRQGN